MVYEIDFQKYKKNLMYLTLGNLLLILISIVIESMRQSIIDVNIGQNGTNVHDHCDGEQSN